MSRSVQHYAYTYGGFSSDKLSKRWANRRLRRASNLRLLSGIDLDAMVMPHLREVSNPWSFAKDGKIGMGGPNDPDWKKLRRK